MDEEKMALIESAIITNEIDLIKKSDISCDNVWEDYKTQPLNIIYEIRILKVRLCKL